MCFYCANSRKKKKLLFTAQTCKWSYGGKPEIKNSFYCTNSCVLIARTQPKKEKFLFTARTSAWSHKPSTGKKKSFFTARTRSKAREKLLPYICQEKKLTFCIMRKKQKFILLQEFNETASCSYCANSIFFFKMHELYPKLVKFILSTSITDIKKKKPF